MLLSEKSHLFPLGDGGGSFEKAEIQHVALHGSFREFSLGLIVGIPVPPVTLKLRTRKLHITYRLDQVSTCKPRALNPTTETASPRNPKP